jgi:hypothetical protein
MPIQINTEWRDISPPGKQRDRPERRPIEWRREIVIARSSGWNVHRRRRNLGTVPHSAREIRGGALLAQSDSRILRGPVCLAGKSL